MDKPPTPTEKEKLIMKSKYNIYSEFLRFIYFNLERKQEIERRQNEEKEKLKRFKERVEAKLKSHFKDPKNIMLKFEPMDQICRSIV